MLKNVENTLTAKGQIEELHINSKKRIIEKYKTIGELSKGIENTNLDERIKVELRFLYALPVYKVLLEKFGVNSIAYSYFNLRYGLYIHRFVYGIKDVNTTPSSFYS